MHLGGGVASARGCATTRRVEEIGLSGSAAQTRHSSLIGRYAMAMAEHREPCESKGSCTVLGAPGGEIPPGDSTKTGKVQSEHITSAVPLEADVAAAFLHFVFGARSGR